MENGRINAMRNLREIKVLVKMNDNMCYFSDFVVKYILLDEIIKNINRYYKLDLLIRSPWKQIFNYHFYAFLIFLK